MNFFIFAFLLSDPRILDVLCSVAIIPAGNAAAALVANFNIKMIIYLSIIPWEAIQDWVLISRSRARLTYTLI